MKRQAVITNNIITNIISAEDGWVVPGSSVIAAEPHWKIGGAYDNGVYTDPADPAGTIAQINTERDRRLLLGFTYGGNPYDFDPTSKIRISGAGTLAGFAVAAGAPEGYLYWHGGVDAFSWILQNNETAQLDAHQMFALAQYAAQWESRHVFAARVLKDLDPIPANYSDNSYWPVRGT